MFVNLLWLGGFSNLLGGTGCCSSAAVGAVSACSCWVACGVSVRPIVGSSGEKILDPPTSELPPFYLNPVLIATYLEATPSLLIIWKKLLRVLNRKKTSIIYTVSSLDETSDISKLEQFHISDWIVKEQSRRDFSKLIKVEKTDRTLSAFLNEKIKISYTWPWAGSLPWVRRCRWQPSGLETQYLLLGDAILHNAGQDHHKPQGSLW